MGPLLLISNILLDLSVPTPSTTRGEILLQREVWVPQPTNIEAYKPPKSSNFPTAPSPPRVRHGRDLDGRHHGLRDRLAPGVGGGVGGSGGDRGQGGRAKLQLGGKQPG